MERVLDMKIKTMIGVVFLFLVTGAVGGFVGVSVVPERAPIVGTLNLRILIDSLDERKALEKRLDDIESEVQIKLANRRARIDELDADLEDYVPGSAKFEEARNAWGLEAMKYEAFREYSEAKRQYETNDSYRRMYVHIKKDCELFAKKHGLDLIILDDGSEEVSDSSSQSIKAEMKARKIIYGSEILDVTKPFADFMNSRFDENLIEE